MRVDYEVFSKKLKSIRIEKGLKQEDVAKELEISTNTYMAYENNPSNMKLNIFISLGDILEIDILNIFLQYVAPKCSN